MSSRFLDAAASLGDRVVSEAIWHDGRCNWVGVSMEPKEAWHAEYHALEPNLYDGTAGIGLFLAELAAVTGTTPVRQTAVGALRQAAARASAHRREGFHAGSLGIAWAIARAAEILSDEELHETARGVSASAAPVPDGTLDIVLGSAGSTMARLSLAELLDDPGLADDAVAAGEALLARATVTGRGWSWATPDHRRRHLCGVSHGAGGIGWALLELYAASGDDRFRIGAEGAFAYERSWAPDLRSSGHRRGAAVRSPEPIAGSWCHGEAGIALVRLRAVEVLGPDAYEAEATAALARTRRELAAALPYELEDVTLCHGAAGAADVLLSAGDCDLAAELGNTALERYAPTGDWPCGLLGGTTPALYRGLTGIGWFYLRLHNQTTPSPLALPLRLTAPVSPA
jgi:lantibiotic modifying enzyme